MCSLLESTSRILDYDSADGFSSELKQWTEGRFPCGNDLFSVKNRKARFVHFITSDCAIVLLQRCMRSECEIRILLPRIISASISAGALSFSMLANGLSLPEIYFHPESSKQHIAIWTCFTRYTCLLLWQIQMRCLLSHSIQWYDKRSIWKRIWNPKTSDLVHALGDYHFFSVKKLQYFLHIEHQCKDIFTSIRYILDILILTALAVFFAEVVGDCL